MNLIDVAVYCLYIHKAIERQLLGVQYSVVTVLNKCVNNGYRRWSFKFVFTNRVLLKYKTCACTGGGTAPPKKGVVVTKYLYIVLVCITAGD